MLGIPPQGRAGAGAGLRVAPLILIIQGAGLHYVRVSVRAISKVGLGWKVNIGVTGVGVG